MSNHSTSISLQRQDAASFSRVGEANNLLQAFLLYAPEFSTHRTIGGDDQHGAFDLNGNDVDALAPRTVNSHMLSSRGTTYG